MNRPTFYGNNDWRDYLAHHGILGQRKGVRNGPPYPLGAGDHSAAEKKAGWRKSLTVSGTGGSDPVRKAKREGFFKKLGDKRREKTKEEIIKIALEKSDTSLLTKKRDLFSNEELNSVLDRMDEKAKTERRLAERSSVDSIFGGPGGSYKRQKTLEGSRAKKILKNMDAYSKEELDWAIERMASATKLQGFANEQAKDRVRKIVENAAFYSKNIADIASNVAKIKESADKIRGVSNGQTNIQQILQSGDPKQLAKIATKITSGQLQQGITHIENMSKLQNLIRAGETATIDNSKNTNTLNDAPVNSPENTNGSQQQEQNNGKKKKKKKKHQNEEAPKPGDWGAPID